MASRQTRQLLDLLDGFEMTKSQHDWLERRFENMTVCQPGGSGAESPAAQ